MPPILRTNGEHSVAELARNLLPADIYHY